MPTIVWLGSLIISLFIAIFQKFAEFATKRLLILAAVVAGVSSLTVAFFVAIVSVINQISLVVPSSVVLACSFFLPANIPLLFTLIVSARLLRWVYDWNVRVLKWRL